MNRKERVVAEWIGESGVPGRAIEARIPTAIHELDAIAMYLQEQGECCAWVGRSVCGSKATHVVFGPLRLAYVVYREAHVEDGPVVTLVCDRHLGGPDEMRRDMSGRIRKNQDREYRKHLDALGIGDVEPWQDGMFVATNLSEMGL